MSLLLNQTLIDAELPEQDENELKNLRELVLHYKKKIRFFERELANSVNNYKKAQIVSDGQDPHPAWDYVAGVVAPRMQRIDDEDSLTDRDTFACWALSTAYYLASDDAHQRLVARKVRSKLAIELSRIGLALKGKKFCDAWEDKYRIQTKATFRSMFIKNTY